MDENEMKRQQNEYYNLASRFGASCNRRFLKTMEQLEKKECSKDNDFLLKCKKCGKFYRYTVLRCHLKVCKV